MFLLILFFIILIVFGYKVALILTALAVAAYIWNLVRHMYKNNNRTGRYYEKNKLSK